MLLKLFLAYRLYNIQEDNTIDAKAPFQSSFELTGYITNVDYMYQQYHSLFQSSFELMGYITTTGRKERLNLMGFKALSSLRVI